VESLGVPGPQAVKKDKYNILSGVDNFRGDLAFGGHMDTTVPTPLFVTEHAQINRADTSGEYDGNFDLLSPEYRLGRWFTVDRAGTAAYNRTAGIRLKGDIREYHMTLGLFWHHQGPAHRAP
jgi:hypothetical protein